MDTRALCVWLLVAASCGSSEHAPDTLWTIPVGVYSEFLSHEEVEALVPELAPFQASITLAVSASEVGSESLAALLRRAERAHLEVRLWLLLDREEGYWPNEGNLSRFGEAARALLDWLDAEDLEASALVFDMEPSLEYSEQILELNSRDPNAIAALFAEHVDPVAFAASRQELTTLVEEVKARGYLAVCVTYPQVLDDIADGDDDMQDALDIPVLGVPFDEVALMVYQTAFAEGLGAWLGPSLVESYAEDAFARFGDRAVIALGKVGAAGIFEAEEYTYPSPEDLATDILTVQGAGVSRVEIYSLDGMTEQQGPRYWLSASEPNDDTEDGSFDTDVARAFVMSIDQLLDSP